MQPGDRQRRGGGRGRTRSLPGVLLAHGPATHRDGADHRVVPIGVVGVGRIVGNRRRDQHLADKVPRLGDPLDLFLGQPVQQQRLPLGSQQSFQLLAFVLAF
ncbi:hypothetical protein LzC2_35710 [Planctomycetes bacterium LzC2]|uniref:Uncharacterized protein n=1 Tax=Alienimonas chondri TaxID=2681879 RepID=A0ABX1VLJ2_9PLAN|nr:hypothetical protein [Alienimonas chondri]